LEKEIVRPDFWGIPEEASKKTEELANLKKEVNFWINFENKLKILLEKAEILSNEANKGKNINSELINLNNEFKKVEKEFKNEEIKIFFKGKYDKLPAIINIVAGQGGRDAEDFVVILFKMYEGYLKNKNWNYEILHQQFSEETGGSVEARGETGLKNITFKIGAPFAYGYFKGESGVHRLVRVSPFDAKDLRHTSFALVNVMPVLPEIDLKDIELKDEDLKVEFFKSSGPGGQNVNRRETAVRIIHLPTGISASSQVGRSQQQNREDALRLLKLKIFDYLQQQGKTYKEALKEKVKPTWGNQIRNYIFHPYKLVKDLRTGVESSDIQSVLEGDLDKFIEAGIRIKNKN